MPKDGTQRKMFSVVLVGDSDWDDKIAKLEVRLFDRFSRAKKVADQFVGQLGVDRVEIYAGPCEYEDVGWGGCKPQFGMGMARRGDQCLSE